MPQAQPLDPALYTLAWIAPIEIEVTAALAVFDKIHEGHFAVARGQDYVFHAGEIAGYNTILATLPHGSYGTGSAAALASQVKLLFPNLQLGLLVGVAAGLPRLSHPQLPTRDIRLGDILVAQPTSRRDALIAYDLGRIVNQSGHVNLLRDGHSLANIEPLVLSAASKLKQRLSTTGLSFLQHYRQIEYKKYDHNGNTFADPGQDKDILWNGSTQVDRPPRLQRTRVWHGSIGSGDKLMRDATTRDRLRDEFDLIGLEMEAAGVMNTIPIGVIRGVCDYGDGAKDKQWQPYAAAMAAAYAKELLQTIPPSLQSTPAQTASRYAVPLRQECLESLAFPEMESRFRTMDPGVEGTCKWLLSHSEYKRWLNCNGGVLWIKGNPGSGKSTLLKHILDQENTDSHPLRLSFFFKARGCELQQTSLGLFRSLLHQLLHQVPETLPHLLEAFKQMREKYGAKLQWYTRDVWKYVESSLSSVLNTQSVFIYVDALDECGKDDGDMILKGFQNLFSKLEPSNKNVLRICFTCRHQPDWQWQPDYEVHVEQQNRDDISIYVRAQLSSICPNISDLILEGAEGNFLWAYLIVKRVLKLANSRTLMALKEDIQSTPPELNAVYEMAMENTGPDSVKLAQLICFSTRPLSIDEVRWAMFMDAECQHKSLGDCERDTRFVPCNLMMQNAIGELGRGLIETKQLSRSTHVVQFIHQSVKDYFANVFLGGPASASSNSPAKEEPDVTAKGAHRRLYQTCLRYLAMKEIRELAVFKTGTERFGFHFLPYAITSWVEHLRRSDMEDSLAWLPTVENMKQWVEIYQFLHGFSPECPPSGTTLIHVLSRYGIVGALRFVLSTKHSNIDASDTHGRTPLSWAAASGRKSAIVLLLATHQAHLDTRDKDGWTPLWYAAANMHDAVVNMLLLEYEASIHITDNNGQTMLTWAAANGHAVTIKLLLATGRVDANAKDKLGWTPLLSAARHGHDDIVEQLLRLDIDLTWKMTLDEELLGKTVLLVNRRLFVLSKLLRKFLDADNVRQLHITLTIYSLLGVWPVVYARNHTIGVLELGVNVLIGILATFCCWRQALRQNFRQSVIMRTLQLDEKRSSHSRRRPSIIDECWSGWCKQTLLIWAMERENSTAVDLLLDKDKIDINGKDDSGRTLLIIAADSGLESTAKYVLGMAAVDVAAKDDFGNTPLLCAAKNGHMAIVKDLLATGKASINAKNDRGESPLLLAARNGNKAIVEQLLAFSTVDVNVTDVYGTTPLFWAVLKGYDVIVQQLLLREASVELDQVPLVFESPLNPLRNGFSIKLGNLLMRRNKWYRFRGLAAFIQQLLPGIGCDLRDQILTSINGKNWFAKSLLFWAADRRYTTIFNHLVDAGKVATTRSDSRVESILRQIESNGENGRHTSPPEYARMECAGLEPVTADISQHRQLLHAASLGNATILRRLLKAETVDINTRDHLGRTPLLLAARNGHETIVQQLLALQTVSIDAPDINSYTPLLLAAVHKHKDIVHQLLLKGASIEWRDMNLQIWFWRFTRWVWLISKYYCLVFPLLILFSIAARYITGDDMFPTLAFWLNLSLGGILGLPSPYAFITSPEGRVCINVKLRGWYSRALLYWAIEGGYETIVKLLVESHKVDVGADAFGRTALTRSAMKGNEAIVRILLTKSILDVNAPDKDGRTALSWAVANGHEAIVRLLIDNGSIASIADKAGRTPLWFATEKGRSEIGELLAS